MEQKSFFGWIKKHIYVLLVFGGILLIVLSLKTQTVLITDQSEKHTVQLEYTMFGYCVSAVPMNNDTRNISTEHMFFLGGMDQTVYTAGQWIYENSGKKGIKVYVSGYPRNNQKLYERFHAAFEKAGINAEELSR